ncbi:MAG: hypothetical protein MUO76_19030 [Anaerolineaceae bacterium]|nr:hypothetical protein [Anaerolineaceae bacterium]
MQREIEAAGFATITISNIQELTASVCVPRLAAIGYPVGLPFGRPGDSQDQMSILRAVLAALEEIRFPGTTRHLPFVWQEKPHIRRILLSLHRSPGISRGIPGCCQNSLPVMCLMDDRLNCLSS